MPGIARERYESAREGGRGAGMQAAVTAPWG